MSIQAVSWVLEESRSRGFARLVLLSLANYANDDDECWPSMRTIAKNAGISLGSVSNQIQELVDIGELEVVQKGSQRKSSRYRIQRSRDELSVQLCSEQNHQEEEAITTSSSVQDVNAAFSAFLAKRAAEAVRERKRKGLQVLSPGGLARSIQQDPEFLKESRELWKHRDCDQCNGRGVLEEYSPGAGMTAVKCNA